jgi:nicotinamidase-related amidase
MKATETALVLIGFQNDYFSKDGILRCVIEESAETNKVLENTLRLVDHLSSTDTLILETPILFTNDYNETKKLVGLLKAIAELKAFQVGTPGADTLPEIKSYGSRIQTVPGKDGFNAFSHTGLARVFEEKGIRNVVLAGAVTSICIDSTGRSAHERGYAVTVLSDCTCGRTDFEQRFYCEQILPLYADVCSSKELLDSLT